MASLSTIIQETEQVLDELRRIIDHKDQNLCASSGGDKLVGEQRRETSVSERSTLSAARNLIKLPSPQAARAANYLDEGERLWRPSVNENINVKRRTGAARGNALGNLGSTFDSMGTMAPGADTPPAQASTILVSNSISARSGNPAVLTEPDDMSDLQAAINGYVGIASERNSDRPTSKGSGPLPPTPRRATQSGTGHVASKTTGSPAGGFSSIQRPTPALPQSFRQPRTPRPFPLPQFSRGPHDSVNASQQRGSASMTKCMVINYSTVNGLTMNNSGSHNSGSVICMVVPPRRSSERFAAFKSRLF